MLSGRIACTQCIRCGLLLQMSHASWSVCWSHGYAVHELLNRSRCLSENWLLWVRRTMHVLMGSRTDGYIRSREGWQVGDAAFCRIPLDSCCQYFIASYVANVISSGICSAVHSDINGSVEFPWTFSIFRTFKLGFNAPIGSGRVKSRAAAMA